tara:strand:- start:152 stop:808 length:657 start_codon:yes stop_codon:yes gene_type:complete
MTDKIKIAIAEDHQLMRQGMVSLLKEEEHLDVVFDVGNGQELLDELKSQPVDIVLLDLDMPIISGQQALKIIQKKHPSTLVIIISMFYSDDFISECITTGARGFLPKNSDIEEVINAIDSVYAQGYYFDDKISKALLHKLVSEENVKPLFMNDELTEKEIEIIKLICEGNSNKEISVILQNSVRTIENHRNNIKEKSNSKNSAGIVIYAIKKGYYRVQ